MSDITDRVLNRRSALAGGTALAVASIAAGVPTPTARAQTPPSTSASGRKPNILMIMADDIGWFNVSAYNLGVMGYRTPNIDRIAKEGALFTDWYGEQSCTAGRAAFITGQSPIRTGLTKVGLPGAAIGLHAEDMCVAEALKPLGYATGQFGKNHLGDRNEYLPTVHGFDEFFGNLYHLNAEEEPQNPDYPKNPKFRTKFGPRGVLKCKATDTDDATVDPAYGRVGKQVIENTGPLDTKRMETVDEEFIGAAMDFIDRKNKANTPWFCYFNPTRMHVWTHLKPASQGKTKLGVYPDGMVELDGLVGQLLKQLDDLGIADNTIVLFTSDNGAEIVSWPDGGATPFRGEKATNWEGGYRVPMVIRWPGTIKSGTIYNDMSHITTCCRHLPQPAAILTSSTNAYEVRRSATRPSRSISTASISFPSSKAKLRRRRARSSSTGTMTVSSLRSGSRNGNASSSSRTTRASAYGPGNSPNCAYRSYSICAPIRSSAATNPSSMTNG